nr:hypothetical protein HK105_000742 [Polyrhizophydium stewartii]
MPHHVLQDTANGEVPLMSIARKEGLYLDDLVEEEGETEAESQNAAFQVRRSTRVQRDAPTHLEPIVVEDQEDSDHESEHAEKRSAAVPPPEIEPFDFDHIDDVDQIGSRYAEILESRIRKLRGENSGVSSTPIDFDMPSNGVEATLSEQVGISNWQEDMIVKSIQLISENRKKQNERGKAGRDAPAPTSPLPFAKYMIVDPFLQNYKPRLPPPDEEDRVQVGAVSTDGATEALEQIETKQGEPAASDPDEKDGVQHVGANGRRDAKPKIEFLEVVEAERNANETVEAKEDSFGVVSGSYRGPAQIGVVRQSALLTDTQPGLEIKGARMHIEMGTLARGTANLGSSWTPPQISALKQHNSIHAIPMGKEAQVYR